MSATGSDGSLHWITEQRRAAVAGVPVATDRLVAVSQVDRLG